VGHSRPRASAKGGFKGGDGRMPPGITGARAFEPRLPDARFLGSKPGQIPTANPKNLVADAVPDAPARFLHVVAAIFGHFAQDHSHNVEERDAPRFHAGSCSKGSGFASARRNHCPSNTIDEPLTHWEPAVLNPLDRGPAHPAVPWSRLLSGGAPSALTHGNLSRATFEQDQADSA
jgi:hypothetical protein